MKHAVGVVGLAIALLNAGRCMGGETDVIDAIKARDVRAVDHLVLARRQAAVSERDAQGATPLHWAAARDDVQSAGVLLTAGADANACTFKGQAPLIWAARCRSSHVAALLLSHGAEVDMRARDGHTALHWAALANAPDVARALIAAGADVNAKGDLNRTPADIARLRRSRETEAVLAEAGARASEPSGVASPSERRAADEAKASGVALPFAAAGAVDRVRPAVSPAPGLPPWYEQDRGRRIVDEGSPPHVLMGVVLYPVNRVGDFVDIFTLQGGLGFGLHGNLHATRLFQLGGGFSATSRLGLDGRRVGTCNDMRSELSVLPFSVERVKRHNAFGTFRDYSSDRDLPLRDQVFRDYWGLGMEGTLGILNLGFEGHVKEVPDLVLGLVGVDYMNDDRPHRREAPPRALLSREDSGRVRRVVLVPSKVIRDPAVRMAQAEGVGAYYHRFTGEAFFGKLGGAAARGEDERMVAEYSRLVRERGFDIHRELLERLERTLTVDLGWDVVGVDDMLSAFDRHAVIKTNKGQDIRRLPNYPGLARAYGADAVLDVRVRQWGVWRDSLRTQGAMRLEVEYKLIRYPENEVLFHARGDSRHEGKEGQTDVMLARQDGQALVRESREACEVVEAQMHDLMVEAQ